MKIFFYEDNNQIHNFISSSGSGTVINYGSGSDFLTNYGSGSSSGSTSQKVTVPTVPVPVPQHCRYLWYIVRLCKGHEQLRDRILCHFTGRPKYNLTTVIFSVSDPDSHRYELLDPDPFWECRSGSMSEEITQN